MKRQKLSAKVFSSRYHWKEKRAEKWKEKGKWERQEEKNMWNLIKKSQVNRIKVPKWITVNEASTRNEWNSLATYQKVVWSQLFRISEWDILHKGLTWTSWATGWECSVVCPFRNSPHTDPEMGGDDLRIRNSETNPWSMSRSVQFGSSGWIRCWLTEAARRVQFAQYLLISSYHLIRPTIVSNSLKRRKRGAWKSLETVSIPRGVPEQPNRRF